MRRELCKRGEQTGKKKESKRSLMVEENIGIIRSGNNLFVQNHEDR